MTSRVVSLLLGPSLLFLGSCGAPDISGELSDYAAAAVGSVEVGCNCPDLLGYASISECDDDLGKPAAEVESCLADALEGDEERAQEYLACATAVVNTYTDCLAINNDCEETVLDLCTVTRDSDLEACPSSELRTSVEQCDN